MPRDMALRPWHLLSLCDGYGGTELALRSVAPVRTVARVERDAYAAAVLVERMGQARLDQCPIWDDVATFDGEPWRGRVDIVAAGFPCQPFSSAGRRGGTDDDRWLWPGIERVIREVEPGFVLLENVGQLVAHGLPEVLYSLASLGFDAEWGLLSASAVGAPHKRERLWIVAHSNNYGFAWLGWESEHDRDARHDTDRCDGPNVGHAARGRCLQGDRPDTRHGRPERIEATVGFPPGRNDREGWESWIAAGGPQPVLRRLTDGPPLGLADALHLGGNGLVPQCAAHGWRQLLNRSGWGMT